MDKVVLISGASAGIGQACADRLFQQGWKVFGASRRGTSSSGWTPITMDVDNDVSVEAGFAVVTEECHQLDALVACAGWGLSGAVERTSIADARAEIETNFWGSVRMVQRALPVMRRQGHGRIVLISSIGGIVSLPFQAFYSASKFAMEGFGEALDYEVEPFNIHVTLVEPGNVRTEFTDKRRSTSVRSADDPYGPAVAKAIDLMSKDESNGVPPNRVAIAVQRVLESKQPSLRVSVGKVDERIGILAKRLLPYRLFKRAAKSSLGV